MAGAAVVAQLWAMLDEMAENDPPAYRRFLRQQRAEAERFYAPPEPHLCLRARPAGAVERPLFINVCGWRRVPAPKAAADPTPVRAGPLEAPGEGDPSSVIDVAYNPDVLQRAEENPEEMDHLIRLTLKVVEEQCSLTLSDWYTVESSQLKGSLEMMRRRLEGRQVPAPSHNPQKEELTLAQLLLAMEAEDCSKAPVLLKEESTTEPKAHLIQEIPSMEMAEKLETPVYKMSTMRDENKKPLRIELKVELPKVSSVSECDLRISKDDIIIEVPAKYKLQVDLPELVDEERAAAAFNKGTGVLFITVPVAKADP